MILRRIALVSLFVLAFSVLETPLNTALAQEAAVPQKKDPVLSFVEGMANEAIQALTAKGISRSDRIIRFREILNTNFDVPLIGKWVLGRYWRGATDDEKKTYLALFQNYIVVTYIERFDQYSGAKLNVLNSIVNPGKDTLVMTEINRPAGGDPIRVNWRVRATSDVYKIIDVYVEGISMSLTQRKEFASVLRNSRSKISSLNDMLRQKVADLQ